MIQKSQNAYKVQLAKAVCKGKIVELRALQDDYVKRYKEHAVKFGKDPNDVPRTIYADLIEDFIKRLEAELKEIEGRDVHVLRSEKDETV